MIKYCSKFVGNSSFLWLVIGMALFRQIYALPENAVIVGGDVDVSMVGDSSLMIEQRSQTAVIDYDNFSVSNNESVNIHQPDMNAVLVNRVIGSELSEIYGQINANGKVFLVNQNGVFFGESAQVDVGSLLVSSQNISNENILNGHFTLDSSTASASIINHGRITSHHVDGVAFIAPVVINHGNITAVGGDISMATNDALFIRRDDSPISIMVEPGESSPEFKIENHGHLSATKINDVGGNIYLIGDENTDIDHRGEINISSHIDTGSDGLGRDAVGDVVIRSNRISHQGSINASAIGAGRGGNITLRSAEFTSVGKDSQTRSNGGADGDGGDIILFSSQHTRFDAGAIVEAKGGRVSGDGGYVDVSGLTHVDVQGSIDVSSHLGMNGTVLIDPDDITITNTDNLVTPASPFQSSAPGSSTLNVATIEAVLSGGGHVEVRTDVEFGDGESGNILVATDINLDGANGGSLTLNALGNITLANNIDIADQNTASTDNVDIQLIAGGSIDMIGQASIDAGAGVIDINAVGGLNLGNLSSASNLASAIRIQAANIGDVASASANINAVNGGADITVVGDISPGLGLRTDVDQLSLNAGGNVWIREESDLLLSSVSNVNDLTLEVNSGDLIVSDSGLVISGNLIIDAVDISDTNDRDIRLGAQSAFLDITNLNSGDTLINSAFQLLDLNILGNDHLSINNTGDLQLRDANADGVVAVYRTDSLSIATSGDLTVANDININSNNSMLSLSANNRLIINDGVRIADQTPGSNSIDNVDLVLNSGDTFTLNDTHEINTTGGTITITSNGDATLTNLSSVSTRNNAISVNAVNGAILDGGNTAIDISATAGGIVLSSANGMNDIELETPRLSLSNTGSGNLILHQQNNTNINLMDLNVNGDTTIDGVGEVLISDLAPVINGDLNIVTQLGAPIILPDSGLIVAGDVNLSASDIIDSDNTIILAANEATLDLRNSASPTVINSQVNNLRITNGSSTNLAIRNDRDLILSALFSQGDVQINTTSGDINIANDINLDGANGLNYTFDADQDINLSNGVEIRDQDTVTADDIDLVFNTGRDLNAISGNVIHASAGAVQIRTDGVANVSGIFSDSAAATAIRVQGSDIQGDNSGALDLNAPNGGITLMSDTAIGGQGNSFLDVDTPALSLALTNPGVVRVQSPGDLSLTDASGLSAANFVIGGTFTLPDTGLLSTGGLLSIFADDVVDSDRSLVLQANQLLMQVLNAQGDTVLNTSVDELDIDYGGNNNLFIDNAVALTLSDLNADSVAASVSNGNLSMAVANGDFVVNADIIASDVSADGVRAGLIDVVVDRGNIAIGSRPSANSVINIRSNNRSDASAVGGLGTGIGNNSDSFNSIRLQLAGNQALSRNIRIGSATNRSHITAIGGDIDIDAFGASGNVVSDTNLLITPMSSVEAANNLSDAVSGEVYFNDVSGLSNTQVIARAGRRISLRPVQSLVTSGSGAGISEELAVGIHESQQHVASDPTSEDLYEPENLSERRLSLAIGGKGCNVVDKNFSHCQLYHAIKKSLSKWTLGGQLPPNINEHYLNVK